MKPIERMRRAKLLFCRRKKLTIKKSCIIGEGEE